MIRLMVGLGMLMILIGLLGAYQKKHNTLFDSSWYLKPVRYAWPLGFIAIIAGWTVTEGGRQRWIAYGILRTADAVSPVTGSTVAFSLALFVLVYVVVFSIGIIYIRRMIRKGPQAARTAPPLGGLPNRPLSAAEREEGMPT